MLPLLATTDRPAAVADVRSAESAEEILLGQLSAGGFVRLYRPLAERAGYKAALFLGHALYWHRYALAAAPQGDGWFYQTARRCEIATGLSTREQARVRQIWGAAGVLAERIGGRPARLHYRIDTAALARWLRIGPAADSRQGVTWQTLALSLGRPECFHAPLAALAGSVAAGLYLSHLLRCQHRAAAAGVATLDGFFAVSHAEFRAALGLSAKTERNARERLRARGWMHEHGGACRVDVQAVSDALNGRSRAVPAAPAAKRLRLVESPDVGRPVHPVRWLASPDADTASAMSRTCAAQRPLFARWPDAGRATPATARSVSQMFVTSSALCRPQVAAVAATPTNGSGLIHSGDFEAGRNRDEQAALLSKQGCPFVESSVPFCRNHIKETIKNKEKTTTARTRAARRDDTRFDETAGRRCEHVTQGLGLAQRALELQMPKALDAVWHASVRRTLEAAPASLRQKLLDELEGQLGMAGKTIRNPPGWLHSLITAHRGGTLTLAMAEKIAADRARRERLAAAIAKAASAAAPVPLRPERIASAPRPSATAQAAREQLRALRRQITGTDAPTNRMNQFDSPGNDYQVNHFETVITREARS